MRGRGADTTPAQDTDGHEAAVEPGRRVQWSVAHQPGPRSRSTSTISTPHPRDGDDHQEDDQGDDRCGRPQDARGTDINLENVVEGVGEAETPVEGARQVEAPGGEQQQTTGSEVGQHVAHEPVHRHADRAAERMAFPDPIQIAEQRGLGEKCEKPRRVPYIEEDHSDRFVDPPDDERNDQGQREQEA